MSYLSTCVHCGICAEACLFYTETGDAALHADSTRPSRMRKLWRREYTFWGKLATRMGLSKQLDRAGPRRLGGTGL